MSPSTPFPLLDLPSLAFQDVVSFWSIIEQNNLSMVSKEFKQRLLSEYLPRHVDIYKSDMNDEQFIELISLMNSMKTFQNLEVSMCLSRMQDVANFMKYFKKPTKSLSISVQYDCSTLKNSILFEDDYSILENLKCEYSRIQSDEMSFSRAHWVGLKELFALDFKTAKFERSRLKSHELNEFLKSWKEGKTNKRMKKCEFEMKQITSMKEVFDGLSPIFENPTDIDGTTGEFKLQRDDGKVAVLKFKVMNNFSNFFSRRVFVWD